MSKNENDNKTQGQKLKKIRLDLNLTQNEIADKMGISQVMWCRYESEQLWYLSEH